MPAIDAYVSREVTLDCGGRSLALAVSLDLFSSHQVDVGTRMLLRTLQPLVPAGGRVLDLGCGYGPLGLALATLPAVAGVDLVDRDALALGFARENARRNGLADPARLHVAASLGLDDVHERYDLVVSNLPGKAGEPVIASLLAGACAVLRPGGWVAIVVIEPIRLLVEAALAGMAVEVTYRHDTADYSVFHYRPTPAAAPAAIPSGGAFAAGVYDRGTLTVEGARGGTLPCRTVHGLAHGDRLDPLEAALAKRMSILAGAGARETVLVSNPGQGVLPLYARSARPQARIVLVDRDLLALRNAHRNLLANGCPAADVEVQHRAWWEPGDASVAAVADLALAVLRERAGPRAVEGEYRGLAQALRPGGTALIAASSTAATRLLAAQVLPREFHAARTRHRGASIVTVTRAA